MAIHRRWFLLLAPMILVAGCGGVKPHPFSVLTKSLGENVLQACKDKDKGKIDRAVSTGEGFNKNGTMTKGELAVLKKVQEYAEKGEWEKAQKLMVDSLAIKI